MALNKYMHDRNIYKTPPDFGNLAQQFTEFSTVAKMDITGKITINFKDPHSLRVLTKCLLKSDFNLDVDIPEDRLVPTLPLRLNYVLWMEDLMKAIKREENVKGLDIGTGACAIYPLLAAVKNKWHMVGTETDDESLQKAQENVSKNDLSGLIELKKSPSTSSVIEHLFNDDRETFDFCMCNPPFYSNVQELCESRSPARLPPKNGFTGSPHELITEGGELEFCRKLIKESKQHKDRVKIFSTMVGHKYNLKELLQDLKADGINCTNTEFCQGRVTRWGLAWTFHDYDLYKLLPPRDKPRKKNLPIVYILPELPNSQYDLETVSEKLKSILRVLKINFKIINKRANTIYFDIKASENTWSNQRRKRRQLKRTESVEVKKQKLNNAEDAEIETVTTDEKVPQTTTCEASIDVVDASNNNTNKLEVHKETTCSAETFPTINESQPVVQAFMKLIKKENDMLLEIEYLDGTAGKEGLHQIVQYIKNNWK